MHIGFSFPFSQSHCLLILSFKKSVYSYKLPKEFEESLANLCRVSRIVCVCVCVQISCSLKDLLKNSGLLIPMEVSGNKHLTFWLFS